MHTNIKVVLSIVALSTVFVIGRYSAPMKIKEETKVIEIKDKTSDLNKHKETTVTEVVKSDGTKEILTKIIEDSNKKTGETNVSQTETKKEVIKEGRHLNLALLVGTPVSNFTPVYGVHASSNVLGPITGGLFGLSNGIVGVSVGLQF